MRIGAWLTLEEINSLVGDQVTGQVLRGVHTAHDEGAVAVGALEQLQKTWLALVLLQFNSATHHGNGFVVVLYKLLASEAAGGVGCLFVFSLPGQPPR